MHISPIKTRVLKPPQDNLYEVLDSALPKLAEGDIVVVTSKVVSIHQGRCVLASGVAKEDLVKSEAEKYLPPSCNTASVAITIKLNTLIPNAGIDESNADGYYILWPNNPTVFAREICQYLKKRHHLKNLGVIISDSHTIPMRWGVIGISIAFSGFKPLYDYRGVPDIFGRKLKMTTVNIPDALAAAAVLVMGEGNEQTPLAIIKDAPGIVFCDENLAADLIIPDGDDIYAPLLKVFEKKL